MNEAIQTPELYNAFVSSIMQCFSKLDDADLLKISVLLDPQRALDARYPSSLEEFIEMRAYRIAQNMTDRQLERFGELCQNFGDDSHAGYIESGERYRHIRQDKPFLDESKNIRRKKNLSEREQRRLLITKRLNEGISK